MVEEIVGNKEGETEEGYENSYRFVRDNLFFSFVF